MKKSFVFLLTILFLSACTGKVNNNNDNATTESAPVSSETSSSEDDGLTEQERKIKAIVERIGSGNLIVSGEKKYQRYRKPNPKQPENRQLQYESSQGLFVTAFMGDYYYLTEQKGSDVRQYRYERREDGYMIQKILNPLTNEVEELEVINPYTGQKIRFKDEFDNVFNSRDAYKCFDLEGNKLIFKASLSDSPFGIDLDVFYSTICSGLWGDDFKSIVVTLDDNQNPIQIDCSRINEGNYSDEEYVFSGTFISEEEANIIPLPEPHEHLPAHEALQAAIDRIKAGNYTLNYTSTNSIGTVNTFNLYALTDAYYCHYDTGFDERYVDFGGYYIENEGLREFKNDAGILAGTGLPMPYRSVELLFQTFWSFKAEMFAPLDEGGYVLTKELNIYTYVTTYFMPDRAFDQVGTIIDDTFIVKVEGNDLVYTYDTADGVSTSCRITNVGSTSLPFAIDTIVPYEPITTMTDFVERRDILNNNQGMLRLELLTGGNVNVMPFIDTPYMLSVKMDSMGNVYAGGLTYTIDAIFTFQFDSQDEVDAIIEQYYEILNADENYTYDSSEDRFLYQHGGVNFQLTFRSTPMQNYQYAMEYAAYNLNPVPPLDY